ncbi:chymotrypsin-2-like [Copidosoma floridanum]|uniref:chymotrypsin-2-like n=1 Tax=Copidosoma floridanum TaxID=29053 RepID=UPI0006C9DF38|nr:chymotrypsin-2-like [Copidosoma floridanum]
MFLITLVAVCCTTLVNGTPVSNDLFVSSKNVGNVSAHSNKPENEEKFDETDLNERLAVRSELVAAGEFPYMVSIQINGQHYCGGALISEKHVLTAGHCVYKYVQNPFTNNLREITVEVGSTRIGSGRTYKVESLTCTKHFTTQDISEYFIPNDIAIITLAEDVAGSEYVKIIKLPPANFELPVGTEVVISGYGSSQFRGPPSLVMKKTKLHTISLQECNQFYRNMGSKITNHHLCTKRDVGYGTCGGDSGSPLIYNRQVIGIVSGGSGRCGIGDPDVFTKVSHYLPFIQYEMGNRDPATIKAIEKINYEHLQMNHGFN